MSTRLPARLERRAIASLRLPARHARLHGDAQIAAIAESMRRFGWTAPVLATPDGEVLAGAARLQAARMLGLTEAPVVPVEGLSAQEIEAYRIADNRLAELASWDNSTLAKILADLDFEAIGFQAIGFTEAEVSALLDSILAPPPGDPDAAVAPPAEPVTKPGDLWLLGQHRVICGDATAPWTLQRLLRADRRPPRATVADIETADLVLTDPPYGMSYKGSVHGGILGDDKRGSALVDLVSSALRRAVEVSRPEAAFYVCLTWRTYAEFEAALDQAGLEVAACIVWDKGSIGPGTLHYRPQHEFIFYCRGGAWFGGKGAGDVWQVSRGATGAYVHPTQKPVALLERAIRNSSRKGDVVLDLFGGSGSTLIACDRLARAARLVELDPKYCDAIVARWERLTGGKAQRIEGALDGSA